MRIVLTCLFLIIATPIAAKGIAGWLGDRIGVDLDPLDDAHRQLKETIPIYGDIEEAGSGVVRKIATELNGEILGTAAAEWIRHSRDDFRRNGSRPLPPKAKAMLYGYFGKELVDSAHYAIGSPGFFNLATAAINLKGKDAIVLIDTIVFASPHGINDPFLLAHEFAHIKQYEKEGLTRFAKMYVKQYDELESEANQIAEEVVGLRYNNVGEAEFASTAAASLLSEFEGGEPTLSVNHMPDDAIFACRLKDKTDIIFDEQGTGYPVGMAYRSNNPNCYAFVDGLNDGTAMCVSNYNGQLLNNKNVVVGECEYTAAGYFLADQRYFSTRFYQITVNGQRAPFTSPVRIQNRLKGEDGYFYSRYTYRMPDGEDYIMYFSESTAKGLYVLFESEWHDDHAGYKIIDYYGERTVRREGFNSTYGGKRTVRTPVGVFWCHQYNMNWSNGYSMRTCIAPGIGEIERYETVPSNNNLPPKQYHYLIAG